MATRKTTSTEETVIDSVLKVERSTIKVRVLGSSPLILHRLSEKSRRDLLLPPPRKTAADKAANLKHDPLREFRDSPYVMPEDAPTLLGILATAFKGAACTAALDLPGMQKTQIGRLVFVEGDMISVYGEPQIFCSVVRMSDAKKTPDVRTRCIVPQWAAELAITYVSPLIKDRAVLDVFGAAGLTAGVGDWRPEKGKGSYGRFELVGENDERWNALAKTWGRSAQAAAIAAPVAYDAETADLLEWFGVEAKRRGHKFEA